MKAKAREEEEECARNVRTAAKFSHLSSTSESLPHFCFAPRPRCAYVLMNFGKGDIMSLIRRSSALITCASLVLMCSCTSYVSTSPLDNQGDKAVGGIVYYLPKTVLEMTVTYSVAQRHAWEGEEVEVKAAETPKPTDGKGNADAKTADTPTPPTEKPKTKIIPKTLDPNGKAIEGIPFGKQFVFISDPIALTPKLVADTKQAYVIDTEELNAINVAIANGKITLNKDGMLTSIGADFQDKTGSIITSVFTSGLNIASAFLMPGSSVLDKRSPKPPIPEIEDGPPTQFKKPVVSWVFKKVVVRRLIDPDDLEKATATGVSDALKNLRDAVNQRLELVRPIYNSAQQELDKQAAKISDAATEAQREIEKALLEAKQRENAPLLEEFENIKGVKSELDAGTDSSPSGPFAKLLTGSYLYTDSKLVTALFPNTENNLPVILFFFKFPEYSGNPTTAKVRSAAENDGLVFRVPGPAELKLFVVQTATDKNMIHLALHDEVSLTQCGFVASLELSSAVLATRTFRLSFDGASGTLGTYEFTTTSSGEEGVKILENISNSLKTQLPNLRDYKDARELDQAKDKTAILEQEKKALEFEKQILEQKKEIERLKRELANPPTNP